jgi:NADPH:quinone reductase-like Zn-dependent oxidoreductase
MDTHCRTFAVDRRELTRTEVIDLPLAAPQPGEVVVRIDHVALTTNNATYAHLGDSFGYWHFFPLPDPWGAVPAWGFGDVVASAHDDIAPGERLYGFFPIATHVHLTPTRVTSGTLVDATPHRTALPSAYNLYLRAAGDPADREALQALLRPVFITSFLLDDLIAEGPPVDQVVLTSASSKTAIGLAWLLRRRGLAVIGLTSPKNRAFVAGLGCCGTVTTYDALDAIPRHLGTATVDFAGNADLARRLRAHLGEAAGPRLAVGYTHGQTEADPDGPPPFSAADRLRQRGRDWGRDGLASRIDAAWEAFAPWVGGHLQVEASRGDAAVAAVYRDVMAGAVPPHVGHMVALG